MPTVFILQAWNLGVASSSLQIGGYSSVEIWISGNFSTKKHYSFVLKRVKIVLDLTSQSRAW